MRILVVAALLSVAVILALVPPAPTPAAPCAPTEGGGCQEARPPVDLAPAGTPTPTATDVAASASGSALSAPSIESYPYPGPDQTVYLPVVLRDFVAGLSPTATATATPTPTPTSTPTATPTPNPYPYP